MIFAKHSDYEGQHAYLGASKYHWVNYTDEKFQRVYETHQMAQRGTQLHEYARMAIELGIKQARVKKTLNMYINDAIGYKMTPEQVLAYSENCFGTADAISFRANKLRIHDLKTGATRVNMKQLELYTAIFCLEYHHDPDAIDVELRIYKDDDVMTHVPDPSEIYRLMAKIIDFDKQIRSMKQRDY